jgi:CubicO group peptidase (beta-lactamase class C family)
VRRSPSTAGADSSSISSAASPIPRAASGCGRTLFPPFSGTKPFAAVAPWRQIEQGRLGLEDPVAAHWPAFGRNGEDRVLIRHVLSHRGGFPTTPPELTPDR